MISDDQINVAIDTLLDAVMDRYHGPINPVRDAYMAHLFNLRKGLLHDDGPKHESTPDDDELRSRAEGQRGS